MAHIPHSEIDYVIETLVGYKSVGEYLIGLETGDYEHMHFVVQMSKEDYHRFSKRVFIGKYKLRGKAMKGEPRQYGKVKAIDNLERMQSYTLKDGNIRTNMSDEKISVLQQQSFKKNEKQTFRQEMVQYCTDHFYLPEDHPHGVFDHQSFTFRRKLGHLVCAFMRERGKILRKTTIQNNMYYVMQFAESPHLKASDAEMFDMMFPNGYY